MLTQSLRSITPFRRSASAAMSIAISGTNTASMSSLRAVEVEPRQHGRVLQALAVGPGGGGGQPAAVAAHDLVDQQHARAGALLVDDVLVEHGALLGRRPGAQRLADRDHVVVDRLRQADHGELVAVLGEVGGEGGRHRVGVVAADGVEDRDAVAGQLLGRDLERVLPLLDQAALHAVGDVGQLDAAVAERRAAVPVQDARVRAHLRASPRPSGRAAGPCSRRGSR